MPEKLVTADTLEPILKELGDLGIAAVQVKWPTKGIPGNHLYQPHLEGWATFAPWNLDPMILEMRDRIMSRGYVALVDGHRAWTLMWAFRQTRNLAGEVWEAGVFQGASSYLLKCLALEQVELGGAPTTIRLFDSFEGMPATTPGLDQHSPGDFANTALAEVQAAVGAEDWIQFHQGWIPTTFAGLEASQVRLAHIDVDLYQSILDCCDFVYPRLVANGIMVFDDYGLAECAGARAAVDFFFRGRPERLFPMLNGQCLVIKAP
ncbi:MAG TPA: TylF/MycF/NovP-related O-methyltransferase, partial [Terriglobales bacterium]|nr:TylF/MycF/NovP-related O-methyltransferase [Terriglobales bacterium]